MKKLICTFATLLLCVSCTTVEVVQPKQQQVLTPTNVGEHTLSRLDIRLIHGLSSQRIALYLVTFDKHFIDDYQIISLEVNGYDANSKRISFKLDEQQFEVYTSDLLSYLYGEVIQTNMYSKKTISEYNSSIVSTESIAAQVRYKVNGIWSKTILQVENADTLSDSIWHY